MITRPLGGSGGGANIAPPTITNDFVTLKDTVGGLQDSGLSLDTDVLLAADSNVKIPSQHAVRTYANAAAGLASGWVNPKSYGAAGTNVTTTGTVTHNSNSVTIADATSWLTGHGVALRIATTVEAFNTYTESDAGNYFTESASQCVVTAIPDNVSNEYVYKNYGAAYFAGDFAISGSWKLTANSGSTVAAACVFALSDTLGQPGNQASGNLIRLNIQLNTTNTTFIMDAIYNGVNTEVTQTMGNRSGVQLWWTLTRVGAVVTCYIYSDSTRTTLLYTKTLTATGISSFQYVYGISGCNYGTTGTTTGFTENLYLSGLTGYFEDAAPYVTISGTTMTMFQTDKTTPFNWSGPAGTVTVIHDDTWAIKQAIQTGKNVHISAGNYNVRLMHGTSSPIFALNNNAQIIEGEGAAVMTGNQGGAVAGSVIVDRDPTADVFLITISNVMCRDFGYYCDSADITKTSGYLFNVQGAATSIATWVQGVAIRYISALAGYGGLAINGYVDRSWFGPAQFLCQKQCLYVNNPSPHGDLHFLELEMGTCSQTGAAGIHIVAADTNNYSNIKVNGSDPPLLIDASLNNVYNQRFVNCSFENGGYGNFAYNVHLAPSAGFYIWNCHFTNGEIGISGGGVYLNGTQVEGTVLEGIAFYLLGTTAVYNHGAAYTSMLGNTINGSNVGVLFDLGSADCSVSGNTSTGSFTADNTVVRLGWGSSNKFGGGVVMLPTASAGTITTGSTDWYGAVTALNGTACTITFKTGRTNTPSVVVTPNNSTAVSWAITAISNTAFTVTFSAAVSGFSYRVFPINE